MPFVLIGFTILLVTFIIALALLIREQSQRADFEAFEGDLNLDAGDRSEDLANKLTKIEESVDFASKQTGPALGNEPNLAEYAPFPWEDPALGLNQGSKNEVTENSDVPKGSVPLLGEDRDNLTGEIRLSDLKKNFS